jgi:hypothetical protein
VPSGHPGPSAIEDHGVKALILASLGLIVILSFRNKNFSVIFDDEVNGK